MANLPWRKFVFLLVQLFFILKFYSWFQDKTHLGLGLYLVLIFILFWLGAWLLSSLELGPSISRLIHYKVLNKFQFTEDWFGFLVVISASLGFFFSRAVMGSAVVTYIAVIAGLVICVYLYRKGTKSKLKALLSFAFVFGIGLGSRYSSIPVIVVLFVLVELFLYFGADLGS